MCVCIAFLFYHRLETLKPTDDLNERREEATAPLLPSSVLFARARLFAFVLGLSLVVVSFFLLLLRSADERLFGRFRRGSRGDGQMARERESL